MRRTTASTRLARVTIEDGRPRRARAQASTSQGFEFADHPTKMKNFADADECAGLLPEMEALIARHTGRDGAPVISVHGRRSSLDRRGHRGLRRADRAHPGRSK